MGLFLLGLIRYEETTSCSFSMKQRQKRGFGVAYKTGRSPFWQAIHSLYGCKSVGVSR